MLRESREIYPMACEYIHVVALIKLTIANLPRCPRIPLDEDDLWMNHRSGFWLQWSLGYKKVSRMPRCCSIEVCNKQYNTLLHIEPFWYTPSTWKLEGLPKIVVWCEQKQTRYQNSTHRSRDRPCNQHTLGLVTDGVVQVRSGCVRNHVAATNSQSLSYNGRHTTNNMLLFLFPKIDIDMTYYVLL